VNGSYTHGDGSADGGYPVRLSEPDASEHADEAVETGDLVVADERSLGGTIRDGDLDPSGDDGGKIETVADLDDPVPGESGGELAGSRRRSTGPGRIDRSQPGEGSQSARRNRG
jgi:hypothetical protein